MTYVNSHLTLYHVAACVHKARLLAEALALVFAHKPTIRRVNASQAMHPIQILAGNQIDHRLNVNRLEPVVLIQIEQIVRVDQVAY